MDSVPEIGMGNTPLIAVKVPRITRISASGPHNTKNILYNIIVDNGNSVKNSIGVFNVMVVY